MASGAFSGTVEVSFAGFRITYNNVQDLIGGSFGCGAHAVVQKGGKVFYLIFRQVEGGHALIRAPMMDEFADLLAVLIMQDNQGTQKIGPCFAALRIAAVAKRAIGRIDFFAGIESSLWIVLVIAASTSESGPLGARRRCLRHKRGCKCRG